MVLLIHKEDTQLKMLVLFCALLCSPFVGLFNLHASPKSVDDLLFRPAIDGFKGKWSLDWSNAADRRTLSFYEPFRELTITFSGRRSYQIRDKNNQIRVRGTFAKSRSNKLDLLGSYRVTEVDEGDLLLQKVLQQSDKKGLSLSLDKDNGLEATGQFIGANDFVPITLSREIVSGRATSLIKSVKISPKKPSPGDTIQIKVSVANLGPVAMPHGLVLQVTFPFAHSVGDVYIRQAKNFDPLSCEDGALYGKADQVLCLSQNLGPKKFKGFILFETKIPENYSSKRLRIKFSTYSPTSLQKVKKDSFRKTVKVKQSKINRCQVSPQSRYDVCELVGGSGLDFALSCSFIQDPLFVIVYHGKVRHPIEFGSRVDKFSIGCYREASLCETLNVGGSLGYVLATKDPHEMCNNLRSRCSNSSKVTFCNSQ